MKMIINAVQNNDYIIFIKTDGDFFAQLGKLSTVQCNNHGRIFFLLNTC